MTDTEALRKINKTVAKAVRANIKAEKACQKAERLEAQLKIAREREYAAYGESEKYYTAATEEGFDWAVWQIGDALQEGYTIGDYLEDLLRDSPKDYVRLLTS